MPKPIEWPYDIAAVLIGIVLVVVVIAQLRRDRRTRSPEELLNRRRNYFPLALVVGIAAFLIPDVVVETVPSHHIDEYVDYTLGGVGILIEHNEPDDVGGDYLTFSLMAVGIAIQLYRLRRRGSPLNAGR